MKLFKTMVFEQSIKYNGTSLPKAKLTKSEEVYEYLLQIAEHDELQVREYFYAIYLNRRNVVVSYATISFGGVAGTIVDIKIIAKHAIDSLASSVIICHNHPSSCVNPSPEDVKLTHKIEKALLLFDIKLLDHIIIGNRDGQYTSLSDDGIF